MTMSRPPSSTHRQPADWRTRAVCRGAPLELFVTGGDNDGDREPEYPPVETQRYCERCPVLPECLAEALERSYEGVWGNTTRVQRDKMKRKLSRVYCLGCGAGDSLVTEGNRQLCLACGVSWLVF